MKARTALLVRLLHLCASFASKSADLKSFKSADDALWYYDAKKGCQEIQNSELSKAEISKFYSQSQDRLLNGVKSLYGAEDNGAIRTFFRTNLPQWNKKIPLVLYPCYAEQAKIGGKQVWVLAFNWEFPGFSSRKGYITLNHIMLFVVDPQSGAILSTATWDSAQPAVATDRSTGLLHAMPFVGAQCSIFLTLPYYPVRCTRR